MPEDLLQTPPDNAPAVPEKFRDPATGALRADALLKSYLELEKRMSQRAAPPAADAPPEDVQRCRQAMGIPDSADGYDLAAPHDLCAPDPAINARLHAANFSNDQAQLVYDLAAERLLPLIAEAAAQYEADRQRGTLVQHYGSEARFQQMASQLAAWGKAKLPPGVFAALAGTADGVLALEQMMRGQEPPLARDTQPPEAASEGELRAMMRDPRYWRSRDPQFIQRVTDGFRRLVG